MAAGSVLGKLYIDPLLSNFAVDYRPRGLIAPLVMPIVPVPRQSGIFANIEQADKFRVPNTRRSPATEANKMRFRVGSGNYFAKNYAQKTFVTAEDLENADPIYAQKLEQARVSMVMDVLGLDWELRVSSLMFNTSNVGSSTATTSGWQVSGGGGSPATDILTAMDNVENATGYRPNTMVIGVKAWRSLRRHNEIINKTKATAIAGGDVYPSTANIAELFELERVLVGAGFYNQAQENQPLNLQPIWADSALLMYQEFNVPSVEAPTAFAAFRWTVAGIPNMQVERLPYDAKVKAQELEAGYFQDEKQIVAGLSFLLNNVNSSH